MTTDAESPMVREMVIDDYDEVAALWRRCEGVGLGDADSRDGIRAYLVRNPGMSFVAVDGGRIVAAALCGTDGRRGYLYHLAVAESHRRSGLGRRVADRCFEALHGAGITRCHIHVFARNVQAREFWRACGLRLREDIVVMSIDRR